MINSITTNFTAQSGSLIALEQTMAQTPINPTHSSESNKESLLDALTALATLLNDVQTQTANAQTTRGHQATEISTALVKAMQDNLKKIEQEIQAAADARAHQSLWDKIINGVTAAVGAILCLIPGGAAIGAPMLMMAISNLTGLTGIVASTISDVLQKMGVPAQTADLLAQVIIFVAVLVATMGTGEGAELGNVVSTTMKAINEATTLAEKATELAMLAPRLMMEIFTNIQKNVTKLASSASKMATAALKATPTALQMAPQLLTTTTAVILANNPNMSDAEKKKIESIMNMVQAIISALLGMFTGAVASTPFKVKLLGLLTEGAASTASGVTNACTDYTLANTTLALTKAEADNTVVMTVLKTNDSLTASDTESFKMRLKNQSAMMASVIRAIEIEGHSYVQALQA